MKFGPTHAALNFSYDNRENMQMYADLCIALINLCRVIPNGVLLIFSSY